MKAEDVAVALEQIARQWDAADPSRGGSHEREQAAAIRALIAERNGLKLECDEVEQTLGKALGYPWYKDDQKNFPGATEADGVCVGEHVPGSIAAEAATKIGSLIAERDALREVLRKIAAPTYGTEWTQTDEEQAEILGRHLFSIQKIARTALDRQP